ncbi:MAG TPA: META domain-containing protein [Vicinamibacterales bacterium]|nr:META domain-containing protein [Vicinamibacterales bacterium]
MTFLPILVLALVWPQPAPSPQQAQPAPASPQEAGGGSLEHTYWQLTRLGETAVVVKGLPREPHLTFYPGGSVIGADGCNALSGHYESAGGTLSIQAPLMGTLMTCTLPDELDRRFRELLGEVRQWRATAMSLELLDEQRAILARFDAVPY